ncbi:MAG: glycosyltransferase [bacterium]
MATLNAGLAATEAPFIARLDADDVLHPDRLALQLAVARRGVDVVGTGVRCFPTQQIRGGLRRYEAWQNGLIDHEALALARFVESPLVHPSVLFAAAAVRGVGGFRDQGWPEDYDLWLRLFEAGARFAKVPKLLTFWREHPRRLTRTAAHCRVEAIRACKVHHLLRGPLRGAAGVWIAGVGPDGKALGRALVAEGARLAGWLDVHPGRLGQRIHGALVRRAEDVALAPGEVVLSAVGGPGGRERVRGLFASLGWIEGRHWWAVG